MGGRSKPVDIPMHLAACFVLSQLYAASYCSGVFVLLTSPRLQCLVIETVQESERWDA